MIQLFTVSSLCTILSIAFNMLKLNYVWIVVHSNSYVTINIYGYIMRAWVIAILDCHFAFETIINIISLWLWFTGIRYLQNFTINKRGNKLKATCHLAKSDSFVDCQIVILNVKNNVEVLSPVNLMRSNFSMLLPSSSSEFLVTARAVRIARGMVYTEKFDISHRFTTTDSTKTNPSKTDSKQIQETYA